MKLICLVFLCHSFFITCSVSNSCGLGAANKVDVKCHWVNKSEDFPSADNIKFQENSIYFIESSCKGGLNIHQGCSVEAAARANPYKEVIVLFAGPVSRNCQVSEVFDVLYHYTNIKIYRIHLKEFSQGTPLEEFINDSWYDLIRKSPMAVSHSSDMLRYLTLYKFGGIYLDLDVIVAKSFDLLPQPTNWVGRESDYYTGAGLISVANDEIGRKFSMGMKSHIKYLFNPKCGGCNSNEGQNNVLKSICSTLEITEMSAKKCQGFQVYPPEFFYPILYRDGLLYYKDVKFEHYKNAFAFHVWRRSSKDIGNIPKNSLIIKLAKLFCPRIYRLSERLGF